MFRLTGRRGGVRFSARRGEERVDCVGCLVIMARLTGETGGMKGEAVADGAFSGEGGRVSRREKAGGSSSLRQVMEKRKHWGC